jgi:hypothetical protein
MARNAAQNRPATQPSVEDRVNEIYAKMDGPVKRAMGTLNHNVRHAVESGIEGLGYDANGYIRFERLEGENPDGIEAVKQAAHKYLANALDLQHRKATGGVKYDVDKLDEIGQARMFNWFGVSPDGIASVARQAKADFNPDAVMKAHEQSIAFAQMPILSSPTKIVNEIGTEPLLKYLGLGPDSPLRPGLRVNDVSSMHLLNLLQYFKEEKNIGKSVLEKMKLYSAPPTEQ